MFLPYLIIVSKCSPSSSGLHYIWTTLFRSTKLPNQTHVLQSPFVFIKIHKSSSTTTAVCSIIGNLSYSATVWSCDNAEQVVLSISPPGLGLTAILWSHDYNLGDWKAAHIYYGCSILQSDSNHLWPSLLAFCKQSQRESQQHLIPCLPVPVWHHNTSSPSAYACMALQYSLLCPVILHSNRLLLACSCVI